MIRGSLKKNDIFIWGFAIFGASWTLYSNFMVLVVESNFIDFQNYAPLAFIPLFMFLLFNFKNSFSVDSGEKSSFFNYCTENKWVIAASLITYAMILFYNRWDLDEVFYASIPVFTLKNPDLPLLVYDGMHGYEGLPILSEIYKLCSFELLAAYISYMSGVNSVFILHIIFPSVYAVLFLVSWYKLFGFFMPEHKKSGLFLVVLSSILLAGNYDMHGHNTLGRFYHGKDVVAFAIVPLITYYSINFLHNPRVKPAILMSLLAITAVGLSSSAIFLILITLGLLSLIYWKLNVRQTVICFFNVATAWYLLLIGIYFKLRGLKIETGYPLDELNVSYLAVYIFGPQVFLVVISIILMWKIDLGEVRNKFLRFFPLILVIIVCVKPISVFLAQNLTGVPTFLRVYWLIPLYLFFPLIFFSFYEYVKKKFNNSEKVAIAIFFGWPLIFGSVFFPMPKWHFSYPVIKAEPDLYKAAEYISHNTPDDGLYLAPAVVAMYIPWMDRVPKAASIRNFYMRKMNMPFGEEESAARRRIQEIVYGGVDTYESVFFRKWVTDLNVKLIAVTRKNFYFEQILEDLSVLGFTKEKEYTYRDEGGAIDIFVKK